jgi:spore coat polysaccharide biosynthesis protein SpsF
MSAPRAVAIIQARMGSTRLPGKVLRMLGRRSVLSHVVAGVRRATGFDSVVIATTDHAADDAIVSAARELNADVFRGSEADVLSRYYFAAREFRADAVCRITSDCPLIDSDVLSAMLARFSNSALVPRPELVSNARVRTFPRGLDAEIFSMDALTAAHLEAREPHQREHVTPFLYENPRRFPIDDYVYDRDLSHLRLTLDTDEDFELLTRIFTDEQTIDRDAIPLETVLALLGKHPDWLELNAHIRQKPT